MSDENTFEQYDVIQHNEVEITNVLRGVQHSNGHWDEDIEAAIVAAGWTCEINGKEVIVTVDGFEPLEFQKYGQVVVPKSEIVARDYGERVQSKLADGIAEELEGRICFEKSTGEWYVFAGVWREDKLGRAVWLIQRKIEMIRETIPEGGRGSRRERAEMAKSSFISGVIKLMKTNPKMAANLEFFDNEDTLLGCPEGYIDLKTGKVLAPDPTKLITKSVAVMPSDKEDCPLFLKALAQSHKGQEEMIPYLQMLAGLCLSGTMDDEVFHYFTGSGGNGKGVFLDPLTEALGDYAGTAQEDAFTVARSGHKGHDQSIAVLRGLRMILLSEPEEGRYWGIDRLKRWTGNEGKMRANLMRQNSFEFRPKGKLIVVANHDIAVTSVNDAIRRRMRKMVWPNKPETADETLKQKIKDKELPGILRWAMNGWKKYQKEGLKAPDKIITATNEYIEDQDYVAQFIGDCLTITEEANTMKVSSEVQPIYDEWARRNDKPQVKRGLAKKLKDAGVPSGKTGAIGNTLTRAVLSAEGEMIRVDLRKLAEEQDRSDVHR